MRRTRADIWILIPGLLLASPLIAQDKEKPLDVDREQEAALLAEAGPAFAIKRTSHFVIAYDTDERVVEALTNRLEQTYHMVQRFCEVNGFEATPLERRLEVLFFDERETYHEHAAKLGFAGAGTSGVYFEQTNRSFFLNTDKDVGSRRLEESIHAAQINLDRLEFQMDQLKSMQAHVEVSFSDGRVIVGPAPHVRQAVQTEINASRKELNRLESRRQAYTDHLTQTVFQHESTHQLFFNNGVHVRGAQNPKWLVEGLATLFETPPGPAGRGFAVVNQLRLRDFRTAVKGGEDRNQLGWRDYIDAVQGQRLASVHRVISDEELFELRGSQGAIHYANTWALMHFLQRTRRDALKSYLQAVSRREPDQAFTPQQELDLFQEHFGLIDEKFLRRFATYILEIPYRPPVEGFQ